MRIVTICRAFALKAYRFSSSIWSLATCESTAPKTNCYSARLLSWWACQVNWPFEIPPPIVLHCKRYPGRTVWIGHLFELILGRMAKENRNYERKLVKIGNGVWLGRRVGKKLVEPNCFLPGPAITNLPKLGTKMENFWSLFCDYIFIRTTFNCYLSPLLWFVLFSSSFAVF